MGFFIAKKQQSPAWVESDAGRLQRAPLFGIDEKSKPSKKKAKKKAAKEESVVESISFSEQQQPVAALPAHEHPIWRWMKLGELLIGVVGVGLAYRAGRALGRREGAKQVTQKIEGVIAQRRAAIARSQEQSQQGEQQYAPQEPDQNTSTNGAVVNEIDHTPADRDPKSWLQ